MALQVTYNPNGSTGGAVPVDNKPHNANDTVVVSGNTGFLVKNGANFDNWNTAADGSGTAYNIGAPLTITANVSLFAQWVTVNGLSQSGQTPNFSVQYRDNLPNQVSVIANANALISVLENEFTVATKWFATPPGYFGTGQVQGVYLDLPVTTTTPRKLLSGS